jgi:hypothetical protein
MSSPVSYDLQGQGGGQVLLSGSTLSKTARWIQCLTDCEFSTFTASNLQDATNITGIVIPGGVGIGGRIEAAELTDGLAIAYFQ